MKSGGGLDEIGAGFFGGPAHRHQRLLVGQAEQGRRFDDDLQHRVGNGGSDRRDIGGHLGEVAGQRGADVDDHVDLVGAGVDGRRGLARP